MQNQPRPPIYDVNGRCKARSLLGQQASNPVEREARRQFMGMSTGVSVKADGQHRNWRRLISPEMEPNMLRFYDNTA